MDEVQVIPWLLALATAVWFGLMAYRARRNWFPWALGGALFALVLGTIVSGLLHAGFIPATEDAYTRLHIKTLIFSVILIALPGWWFTRMLRKAATASTPGPAQGPTQAPKA